MAQHYDVAARKSFADRAFRGDEDFDVDVASKFLDSEILKCAEDQYDLLSAKRVANRAPLSRAALRAAPRTFDGRQALYLSIMDLFKSIRDDS